MRLLDFIENMLRATIGPPVRHAQRMLFNSQFREYQLARAALKRVPRFHEVRVWLGGFDLVAPDAASLLSSWEEIFLKKVYEFPSVGPKPRILDLGANIGLSLLYFKRQNPEAAITAFEADPEIFAYLERNMRTNGIDDGVTLINRAVWDRDEVLSFWCEGADGGRIEQKTGKPTKMLHAVDIGNTLRGRTFDFIKMDIEGAESRVLPRCIDLLRTAKAVFIEYHSRPDAPEALPEILSLLRDCGFRIQVSPLYQNKTPFVAMITNGFDQQLNLFAIRQAES